VSPGGTKALSRPHPHNILVIDDDSSSFGDDPVGDDSPGVGRVRADSVGKDPTPSEPFEEGLSGARGSWADSPFDPTPPPARDERDPYFPTSPGGYDGLGATGGSDFQARAPAGAGPGRDERTGVSSGRGSPGRARAPASAGAGPVGGEPEVVEEIHPREERFRPAPGEITTSWLTYEPPPGDEGPRRVLLLYQCEC
jgi:hypothetical protein